MSFIEPKVAVYGCRVELPVEFPTSFAENSGNMIHARAPIEMFSKTVYSRDRHKPWGRNSSFRKWANTEATHLVITLANIFRLKKKSELQGPIDGSHHTRFQRMLESYDTKLVVFGLGVQAPDSSLEDVAISSEAIELMQYLGERCELVGVRGEFTKKVFEHFAGVKNTFVTGCPSLFSRPEAIGELYDNWQQGKVGLRSYAGTNFYRETEKEMLLTSTKHRQFLVEPVSKANHQFYLDIINGVAPSDLDAPYYLKSKIATGETSLEELSNYYSQYYRLFRQPEPWLDFYREHVSFSYGSRFHVNMASLLAGTPALWLTHDARTSELVEFLHLPNLPLHLAAEMSPQEIEGSYDPSDFFDNIRPLFDNWNEYLSAFDLPPQKLDF